MDSMSLQLHDRIQGAGPAHPQASAFRVRRFPYPYEAALAICSDLDETPNRDIYYETAKFLNTTEMTSMGRGVGLEVGNTIYFDMPQGQFSYWNTDDAGRAMVRELIRSGHIDCLHSYGDHATLREHVQRALDSLAREDCRLEVWVDHAKAPTNFGSDIMRGHGDVPGSPVYHADLSCEFGIRFVWMGRVTSVIGQESSLSLKGIWSDADPAASFKTLSKELVKGALARMGYAKYGLHHGNPLMRSIRLRDGRDVLEFMRCNPNWKGVGEEATADGIAQVLIPRFLDRLVERKAACILYTHLGKIAGRSVPFAPPTIDAFHRLAEYSRDGRIWVTTTSRLLKHAVAVKQVSGSCVLENGRYTIRVRAADPRELTGLTIYTPEPVKPLVLINDQPVEDVRFNPPDRTGQRSVSLPLAKLEFPLW
jgi:hypothetical protein